MQGRRFLEVAQRLGLEEGEPFLRNRVGRAYYAAYLEARQFCEQHLLYTRTKSSREHQDVLEMIRDSDPDLVVKLALLRKYQNTADYDMDISMDAIARNAEDSEAFAIEIIARLDELAMARAEVESDMPNSPGEPDQAKPIVPDDSPPLGDS
jgi:uncharacterized protein (UPF0332 family)